MSTVPALLTSNDVVAETTNKLSQCEGRVPQAVVLGLGLRYSLQFSGYKLGENHPSFCCFSVFIHEDEVAICCCCLVAKS